MGNTLHRHQHVVGIIPALRGLGSGLLVRRLTTARVARCRVRLPWRRVLAVRASEREGVGS